MQAHIDGFVAIAVSPFFLTETVEDITELQGKSNFSVSKRIPLWNKGTSLKVQLVVWGFVVAIFFSLFLFQKIEDQFLNTLSTYGGTS